MAEPSYWVKIFIDGTKVVDDRLYPWNVKGLSSEHLDLVAAADRTGHKWLVEVIDPDAPEDEAHLRFGSDTGGMVDPVKLDLTTLPDHIRRRR